MPEPIGHAHLRAVLEQSLPQVTLLQGPRGVGKASLASWLIYRHGVQPADRFRIPLLTMDSVKELYKFTYAPGRRLKGVLINLDTPKHYPRNAHERSQNSLLNFLENPGDNTLVIMTASASPISTVQSRAVTYHVGLLTDNEVAQSLVKQDMNPDDADKLYGTTAYGVKFLEQEDLMKSSVGAVLKAVETRDRDLMQAATMGWKNLDDGRVALAMLKGWIYEALIGEWIRYSPDAALALSQDRGKLKGMLTALDYYSRGNPKIAVRAALDEWL